MSGGGPAPGERVRAALRDASSSARGAPRGPFAPGPWRAPRAAAPRAPSGALGLLASIAIASTVFNDMPPLLPAGELSNDPFILLFPLLCAALLPGLRAFGLSRALLLLAGAFLGAALLSVWANHDGIAAASFQGRAGYGRVFSQGLVVGFGLAVALVAHHLAARGHLGDIGRGARWGLAIMLAVGALELASWFGTPLLTQIHDAISVVVHWDDDGLYPRRLRSTAFEVSWAAVILTFVFPFAFASAKGRTRAAFALGTVALVALSGSRTAMLVFAVQFAILGLAMLRGRLDRALRIGALAALAALALLQVPSVGREIGTVASNLVEYGTAAGPNETVGPDGNVSNVTRLAHIRMGLEMFAENPVLGVGFGQYGFHYPDHVRAEDLRSWEVRAHLGLSGYEIGWPPIYSNHVRVMAEMGGVGLAAWVLLLSVPLVMSACRARDDTEEGRHHVAVVMTLVGWIALGASIDTFRFFGGFVAIGVALALARRPAAVSPTAGPARGWTPEVRPAPATARRTP